MGRGADSERTATQASRTGGASAEAPWDDQARRLIDTARRAIADAQYGPQQTLHVKMHMADARAALRKAVPLAPAELQNELSEFAESLRYDEQRHAVLEGTDGDYVAMDTIRRWHQVADFGDMGPLGFPHARFGPPERPR